MFSTELELHQSIREFLLPKLTGGGVVVESEVEGLFGIPDIVIAEKVEDKIGHIIALELKLSSWKRAIKQAFRYRSFAWESYVVIDKTRSSAAAANLEKFRQYNIGLATYSVDGEFEILYRPEIKPPYSAGLFRKLCSLLFGQSLDNEIKIESPPCRNSGLGRVFQDLPKLSHV